MENSECAEDGGFLHPIPEITLDDFATSTFGVDIRNIEFIPTPIEWFFNHDLNLQEQRLLTFIRFKENRKKKYGCILTNNQFAHVMQVSVKRIQNMLADLKARGYLTVEYDGYRSLKTNLTPDI